MRGQKLREKLNTGTPALNGWCNLPCPPLAELLCHQGYDSVTIDMQHGLMGYETALGMLQAISTTEVTPLVRVPSNEAGIIGRMLDSGALGIICPMINTVEQARAFIDACLYAPNGGRSFGPIRASLYTGGNYAAEANDRIMPFAMIETVEAFENLDAILDVEGIYGLYIGPADFTLSFGHNPGTDQGIPAMVDRYKVVIQAARKRGIKTGMHCSSLEQTQAMRAIGFDFVTAMTDMRLLSFGAQTLMKSLAEKSGVSAAY